MNGGRSIQGIDIFIAPLPMVERGPGRNGFHTYRAPALHSKRAQQRTGDRGLTNFSVRAGDEKSLRIDQAHLSCLDVDA